MTIEDKSIDSKVDTYTLGDNNQSYYKQVIINLKSSTNTDLVVKYSLKSGQNITFAAAALRDASGSSGSEQKIVYRDIEVQNGCPDKRNLTEEGNIDWLHLGTTGGANMSRKADAEQRIFVNSAVTPRNFKTHKTLFSWTDGTPVQAVTDDKNGYMTAAQNGGFTTTVKVGPEEQILTLYIGGWKSKSKLTIYDESGLSETQVYEFGDVETNYYQTIKIRMSAKEESSLRLEYIKTGGSGNGNITWVAATLHDPHIKDKQLNPTEGTLKDGILSGAWIGQTAEVFKTIFDNDPNALKITNSEGEELSDTDLIATGDKVELYYNIALIDQAVLAVVGDVDNNGSSSVTDLVAIKSMILGRGDYTEAQFLAADINKDAAVNIFDLVELKLNILQAS